IRHGLPSLLAIRQLLFESPEVRQLTIEALKLGKWDSALLTFLFSLVAIGREHGAQIDLGSLPEDASSLVELALSGQRPASTLDAKRNRTLVTQLGEAVLREGRAVTRLVTFFGDSSLALLRLLRGRARYRSTDLILAIEGCGACAFPIVSIISLLVG